CTSVLRIVGRECRGTGAEQRACISGKGGDSSQHARVKLRLRGEHTAEEKDHGDQQRPELHSPLKQETACTAPTNFVRGIFRTSSTYPARAGDGVGKQLSRHLSATLVQSRSEPNTSSKGST